MTTNCMCRLLNGVIDRGTVHVGAVTSAFLRTGLLRARQMPSKPKFKLSCKKRGRMERKVNWRSHPLPCLSLWGKQTGKQTKRTDEANVPLYFPYIITSHMLSLCSMSPFVLYKTLYVPLSNGGGGGGAIKIKKTTYRTLIKFDVSIGSSVGKQTWSTNLWKDRNALRGTKHRYLLKQIIMN